jgi:hypothetical protein
VPGRRRRRRPLICSMLWAPKADMRGTFFLFGAPGYASANSPAAVAWRGDRAEAPSERRSAPRRHLADANRETFRFRREGVSCSIEDRGSDLAALPERPSRGEAADDSPSSLRDPTSVACPVRIARLHVEVRVAHAGVVEGAAVERPRGAIGPRDAVGPVRVRQVRLRERAGDEDLERVAVVQARGLRERIRAFLSVPPASATAARGGFESRTLSGPISSS